MIPKAFAKHHRWPITNIAGYHDVRRRKPDPEGLLLAIKNGRVDPSKVCHVGDHPEDTLAARAAGVLAIGAAWGSEDVQALRESAPDPFFDVVGDMSKFLLKTYR